MVVGRGVLPTCMCTGLVIYEPPRRDQVQQQLGQVDALEFQLKQLAERYQTLASSIRVFECRYAPLIGLRYSDLEELRHKVEASRRLLRERKHRMEAGEPEPLALIPLAAPEPDFVSFRPSLEIRSLYRELVRRIHPDLASDTDEQRRSHEFMAEAGRAYRLQDSGRLQELIEIWESNPERIERADAESEMLWALRRVAQLQADIRAMKTKVNDAEHSALAQLMQQVEQAKDTGFDLLGHMNEQVNEQIQQAEEDYERVQEALADLDGETTRVVKINAGTL